MTHLFLFGLVLKIFGDTISISSFNMVIAPLTLHTRALGAERNNIFYSINLGDKATEDIVESPWCQVSGWSERS
jgi:hypothetical protein